MQIPKNASNTLKRKLRNIKSRAKRLSFKKEVMREELEKLINDVIDVMFRIDQEIIKVKTEMSLYS